MPSILDLLSPPLDQKICDKMLKYYNEAKELQFMQKYAPAMTSYGKFLELLAKAIYYHITNDSTDFSCGGYTTKIENSGISNDNIRLHLTRAIDAIYGIRNGRDVAHSSLKMDTWSYDCIYCSGSCDWILGELLVELGKQDRDTVNKVLTSITTKRFPIVYKNLDDKLIVLSKALSAGKEALIMLYVSNKPLSISEIAGGSTKSVDNFRTQLRKLEGDKYVSKLNDKTYQLLPPGNREAEELIRELTKENELQSFT